MNTHSNPLFISNTGGITLLQCLGDKTMKRIRFTTGLTLLFGLGQLGSAAISSGGGLAFEPYSNNPWFVENTKVVHYCVMQDDSSGIEEGHLTNLIQSSIKLWQQTLTKASYSSDAIAHSLRVGTQEFIKDSKCDENTDIRFQFGILEENQREFIAYPKRTIGFAQKTSYDSKNLRAKGFVYIKTSDNDGAQFCEPVLKVILVHELGHVFGFRHAARQYLVMGETFLNQLVSRYGENKDSEFGFCESITDERLDDKLQSSIIKMPQFFPLDGSFYTCSPSKLDQFGLNDHCLRIDIAGGSKLQPNGETYFFYDISFYKTPYSDPTWDENACELPHEEWSEKDWELIKIESTNSQSSSELDHDFEFDEAVLNDGKQSSEHALALFVERSYELQTQLNPEERKVSRMVLKKDEFGDTLIEVTYCDNNEIHSFRIFPTSIYQWHWDQGYCAK